jgi:hypothetical protein
MGGIPTALKSTFGSQEYEAVLTRSRLIIVFFNREALTIIFIFAKFMPNIVYNPHFH